MRGVVCNHCGERVIPRLWSYEPFFLRGAGYLRTQHICCYCGLCMYETGGGLNPVGKFCVGVILTVFGFAVLLALYSAATRPEPKPAVTALRSDQGHASLTAPVAVPKGHRPDRKERPAQVAGR